MSKLKDSRNIIEYLTKLLWNTKYVVNGKLNRTLLKEDIRSYNEELIEILLKDEIFKNRFTLKISGTTILKTETLVRVLEFKDYMPDNFTKYANEIGIYIDGKNIMKSPEIVLNFPYKDAYLTAGMTKEDVEKIGGKIINELNKKIESDEVFLNEVIAADDIAALKEPKALKNVKKYTVENPEGIPVGTFNDNDNLIIKGNNLIALHSIKKRFYKSIKGIFIDPPYFFYKHIDVV